MKKLLLCLSLMCVCSIVQAEEYTTLTVSGNEQPGAAQPSGAAGTGAAAVSTPAAAPAPATVDPLCAGVICSGQGVCAVASGRPMCACNAGFMPGGPDGLSCLPYTPPAAVLSVPAYADPQRDAALKEFYSVLPNYPAERHYARYARLKQYGRFTGTFPDYMAGKFRGQKGGGIAMIAVGGALTAAAAAFLTVGANAQDIFGCYDEGDYYYNDYYVDDCYEPAQIAFLTFGSVFAVASVVMYSVGIPALVVGASRKKKMDELSGRHTALKPVLQDFRLTFIQDPKLGSYGLGAGFRF